jgi:hypothetical protein
MSDLGNKKNPLEANRIELYRPSGSRQLESTEFQ